MPAPKGNQYAVGNKGGYRKGYEYEEEQKQEMRKNLNWLFAYIKAVRNGKATERQHLTFIKLEKILLKIMDKLHANKQQTEITGEINIQIPIYGNKSISGYNSDTQDISTDKKD
jgi:hypothetical protein